MGRNWLMANTSTKIAEISVSSIVPLLIFPSTPAVSIVSPAPSTRQPTSAKLRLVNPPSTAT